MKNKDLNVDTMQKNKSIQINRSSKLKFVNEEKPEETYSEKQSRTSKCIIIDK